MYLFHGWFVLSESPLESEDDVLRPLVGELQGILSGFIWHNATADLHRFNGQDFLTITGLRNRPLQEAKDLEYVLGWLAEHLPGSYGLLYEWSDYMPVPPGPGAFRVRVLARGTVSERLDPFLSPTNPTVED